MLHVDPTQAVTAARPDAVTSTAPARATPAMGDVPPVRSAPGSSPFSPIAYLAYCRACNVPVTIDRHNSEPRLSWDIHDIRADAQLRHHGDPHLDIDADPQGGRKVYEVLCAEEWIAGARACGLVVAPWREKGSPIDSLDRGGVMQCGQDLDGRNSYGPATRRFMRHPAFDALEDCRKGVAFEVLCAEFNVDPEDPDLCAKVNAALRVRTRA